MNKMIFIIAIAASFGAAAQSQLNCHTDALAIGEDKFQSYDMSLPMNDSGSFSSGAELFENTFPSHPVEPNPFLEVERRPIVIKDALMGADGDALLYFSAGPDNFVLNVKQVREGKLEGTLQKHGRNGVSVEARCYFFQMFP